MSNQPNRRHFLKAAGAGFALPAAAGASEAIEIDPKPRFELSKHLYMQFMEPLGARDGSVEASWDHRRDDWRPDVIAATQELAPTMMRWGGILTDYYRWREGVGPRESRVPFVNLLWGGIESSQVGTAEFVDFSKRAQADPLICVNFESDGREHFMKHRDSVRTAGAAEAAEWVAYCNQPGHAERTAHGFPEPLRVPFWQIGNETSYDARGFGLESAQRKTVEFATAMRKADPSIQLIGWGGLDGGSRRRGEEPRNWAKGMMEAAGDQLDYLAFHHMYNPDNGEEPVLAFGRYRENPARTWDCLMDAWKPHEEKIRQVRDNLGGKTFPLAMTECHYSIPGRNRCEALSTWAAGVSYARLLNVHERHGDLLKIATAADFCGTLWQVNAIMIPGSGRAFLMPVAHVMKLYRHHSGEKALSVAASPRDLDVTASRTGDKLHLHAANTNRTRPVRTTLRVSGMKLRGGTAFEIAADPMLEVRGDNPDALAPRRKSIPASGEWVFPAASVSALELDLMQGAD